MTENCNQTIEHQLTHRTIRAFKSQQLTQKQVQLLAKVVNQTATSMFLQQRTVLHITDLAKRQAICQVSNQSYVGANGDLFIFIVDLFRNQQIRQHLGKEDGRLHQTDIFIQGLEDTVLGVQNFVTAAESLNLGAVILGSINNDPQRMIDILNLPQLTFPVLGVQVGVPDQKPQLKPRLPLSSCFFENNYPANFELADFEAYDQIVQTYYDLRDSNRRIDSFTNQIGTKLDKKSTKRNELLKVLHQQGLCLK
ncbi:NADPH-dependent oxidoreductase [Liquorilactobacillus sicerae]|uniref:NADPH-dependent oxidoreductase n=1 Tax=Liquorilactobacillus sicerae TaxID=1416943 RepID=UPI00248040FA|nr:NADPH-dependent oxidoreductase [Liquorilactobacillus sicerae]